MSSDLIDQVRRYLDFLAEDSNEASVASGERSMPRSPRWHRRGPALAGLVALLVLVVALPPLLLGSGSSPRSLDETSFPTGDKTYTTYVADGMVWIESDCPNTDQVLKGNPDGLPHISSTTDRDAIEDWLGDPDNSRIIPRNGQVWDRTADGRIVVTQVEDWMIEVTIDDPGKCPGAPTSTNGVPVIYRIADD